LAVSVSTRILRTWIFCADPFFMSTLGGIAARQSAARRKTVNSAQNTLSSGRSVLRIHGASAVTMASISATVDGNSGKFSPRACAAVRIAWPLPGGGGATGTLGFARFLAALALVRSLSGFGHSRLGGGFGRAVACSVTKAFHR
jgi:hypothetical protein